MGSRTKPRRMKNALQPYFDRVLVQRIPPTETIGREVKLHTAESFRDVHQKAEGVVLAVGHGRLMADGRIVKLATKAGDRVLFGPYAGGTQLHEDYGERLFMLREDEILARIQG